jgi:hypothetical protein
MKPLPFTSPVEDSVPKVNDAVAVGEDLEFQRRWWRFEKFVWWLFFLILICDLLGLFGRGYLAKAKGSAGDQTLALNYERIERASTPSIMDLHFGPAAVHDGHVQVFVSESVVKELGAQRISPQPDVSMLTSGGIVYTFAADAPATVQIALSPSFPGLHRFSMHVPGGNDIAGKVVVLP